MYRSQAVATEAESEEILRLHESARTTRVIAIGSAHAMTGGASADARRAFIRRLDESARSHGLADQAGEWGFDAETRQFLSEHPIVEDS